MAESKFIQYKNKNIHYRSIGTGRPVVLLHGFAEDGNIWNELTGDLQNNFHLIIPDIPGSGESEMLEGDISIDDYAEVVKEILNSENYKVSQPTGGGDLEGSRAVCFIGHSMGGYITLAFAEKYPELLNGFALFHSSAFADDEEKKKTRRKAIEFIQANGTKTFLQTSIPNLFADKQHPYIEKLISGNFTAEALIQYYYAMINRPDRTAVLKTFKKPVLYIIGEKDTAIPLQISLQQCHLPSIAHVHILQNVGHMGMIEQPEKCKELLLSFLQNI